MELTKLVMDGLMENRLFYLLCVQIIVSLSANILLGFHICIENIFTRLKTSLTFLLPKKTEQPSEPIKKHVLKFGLVSHLVLMPILAFTIGLVLFRKTSDSTSANSLSRLGLFVMGTSPISPMGTWLQGALQGDTSLTVTLLVCSALVNPLVTVFWWNTLGNSIKVPHKFLGLLKVQAGYLATLILPLVGGSLIARYCPLVGKAFKSVTTPLICLGFIINICISTAALLMSSSDSSWRHILSACILIFAGGVLNMLGAKMMECNNCAILSVSLSSVQNGLVAQCLLFETFPGVKHNVLMEIGQSETMVSSAIGLVLVAVRILHRVCKRTKTSQDNSFELGENEPDKSNKQSSNSEGEFIAQFNGESLWVDEALLQPLWL